MQEAGARPQDTILLPESPCFWTAEWVRHLALCIFGIVTQLQEQGFSLAAFGSRKPACAGPGCQTTHCSGEPPQ